MTISVCDSTEEWSELFAFSIDAMSLRTNSGLLNHFGFFWDDFGVLLPKITVVNESFQVC